MRQRVAFLWISGHGQGVLLGGERLYMDLYLSRGSGQAITKALEAIAAKASLHLEKTSSKTEATHGHRRDRSHHLQGRIFILI